MYIYIYLYIYILTNPFKWALTFLRFGGVLTKFGRRPFFYTFKITQNLTQTKTLKIFTQIFYSILQNRVFIRFTSWTNLSELK